jgi:hypothetical protein
MQNVFVDLPVPAGDGAGAGVLLNQGSSMSVYVAGSFAAAVHIEVSDDDVDYAPLASFTGPATDTFEVGWQYARVRLSGFQGGTPEVSIGVAADDSSNQFLTMSVPAGNGTGAAQDTSLMGPEKRVIVSDPFTGTMFIETSANGVEFVTAACLTAPDDIVVRSISQFIRVRRAGVSGGGVPGVIIGGIQITPLEVLATATVAGGATVTVAHSLGALPDMITPNLATPLVVTGRTTTNFTVYNPDSVSHTAIFYVKRMPPSVRPQILDAFPYLWQGSDITSGGSTPQPSLLELVTETLTAGETKVVAHSLGANPTGVVPTISTPVRCLGRSSTDITLNNPDTVSHTVTFYVIRESALTRPTNLDSTPFLWAGSDVSSAPLATTVSDSLNGGETKVIAHSLGIEPDVVMPTTATPVRVTARTSTTVTLNNPDTIPHSVTFFLNRLPSIARPALYDTTPFLYDGSNITSTVTSGWRIDITSYGAVGDGVTNNLTTINNAIAAAKALAIPLYIPPGSFRVIQGGTPSAPGKFLIDWEGAQIMGDGPQSILQLERTGSTLPVIGFEAAFGFDAWFHDFRIHGVGMLATLLGDPDTRGFHLPAKQNDTTPYKIRVERVVVDGVKTGLSADSGSVNSINYLTTELLDNDFQAYTIEVAYFTDPNSTGTKRLHVTRGYYHCQDKTTAAASHCFYVHPNVDVRCIGVEIDNWGVLEYGFQHYGTTPVGIGHYAEFIGCTFGPGGDGKGIICSYLCPTVVQGCWFYCRSGIQIRSDSIISGCYFQLRPAIAGTIFCISNYAPTNANSTLTVTGCSFDMDFVGAANGGGAIDISDTTLKVLVTGCIYHLKTPGNNQFVTGKALQVDIVGCQMESWDDPANTSSPTFIVPAGPGGRWRLADSRFAGDTTVDRGIVRMDAASPVDSVIVENCDFSQLTRGFVFYSNAADSGLVRWVNNTTGTSTTFGKIDCSAGLQRFKMREATNPSVLAPANTAPGARAALTTYRVGEMRTNDTAPVKVYRCITPGTTDAGGGPTGTGADIVDGTVHWTYVQSSTTVALATILNDFNQNDAGGVVDAIFVNGRYSDTSAFEGDSVYLFSTGTLSLTALGNILATAGVRAAGTCTKLRWTQATGLWTEYV